MSLIPAKKQDEFNCWALASPNYVDITSYTASNKYLAQYDGYVAFRANGNYSTNNTCSILIENTSLPVRSNSGDILVIFVKKGMHIWTNEGTGLSTPSYVRFFPILD